MTFSYLSFGRSIAIFLITIGLGSTGCGTYRASDLPDLGEVKGTVTLDGKPLPEATVSFQSTKAGRMSSGATDSEGRYQLYLLNDISGAPLGKNDVYITTAIPADESIPGSGRRETLPAIYNEKSTLSAEVQPGVNTFDFDLKSK